MPFSPAWPSSPPPAVKALHQLPGPLFSCWPLITEAVWLLRSHPPAVQQLLRSCFSEKPGGFLELLPLAGAEASALPKIMKRYQDIRPQLTDVALLYLADREGIDTIFILDRRDFGVYALPKNALFALCREAGARFPNKIPALRNSMNEAETRASTSILR